MSINTEKKPTNLSAVALSADKMRELGNGTTAQENSNVFQLEESSPLRETHSDPFRKPRWLRDISDLSLIIGGMISFSAIITIALTIQIVVGMPQISPHSVVVSDDESCSQMGLTVLKRSAASTRPTASSVDAAIVTALCLIVKNPHLGGLGGGGFMLIQNQHASKNDTVAIDFRELSPILTNQDIATSKNQFKPVDTVAVPGFIRGMKTAHDLAGIGPWKDIFETSSELAKSDVKVNNNLASAIKALNLTDASPELKSLVLKNDNKSKKVKGDSLIQNDLAKTLTEIGENANNFYDGKLATELLEVLKNGNMTLADLRNYTTKVSYDPLTVIFSDLKLLSSRLPSSGILILDALNTMSQYKAATKTNKNLEIHRMLEAIKFSFGDLANMGDSYQNASYFLGSAHGISTKDKINDTSIYKSSKSYLSGTNVLQLQEGGQQHVSVIGHDGYVVTITMGIGSVFGSKIMSSGYVLNNAMLDFSWKGKNSEFVDDELDVSKENYIGGAKRPMSSMFSLLAIPKSTKCGKYFAYDYDGSYQAVTNMVQMLLGYRAKETVEEIVTNPRVGQSITPEFVEVEVNASSSLKTYLKDMGHNDVKEMDKIGVANIISYLDGEVKFFNDPRDFNNSAVEF